MNDNQILFASLNLPENPLKTPASEYAPHTETDHILNLSTSDVSSDILDIIKMLNFKISTICLFTWKPLDNNRQRAIHTDTHSLYQNLPKASINWHLDGPSKVEWYSFKNAKEKWKYKGLYPTTTYEYDEVEKPLVSWYGTGPVLLNISQPHRVILDPGTAVRRSVGIRLHLNSSFEDSVATFKEYISNINCE